MQEQRERMGLVETDQKVEITFVVREEAPTFVMSEKDRALVRAWNSGSDYGDGTRAWRGFLISELELVRKAARYFHNDPLGEREKYRWTCEGWQYWSWPA